MPSIKILGLVKAIHVGSSAPVNTDMLWRDTNVHIHKYYNTISTSWESIVSGGVSWATTLAANAHTGPTSPIIDSGQALIYEKSGFTATIEAGVLSDNRVLQYPNESGILATQAYVGAALGLTGTLAIDNSTSGQNISITSGDSLIFNNGGFAASIVEGTLAAPIVLTLPSTTGTFALVSDISNFANTDLTFDGERIHNTNGNTLTISTDGATYADAYLYMVAGGGGGAQVSLIKGTNGITITNAATGLMYGGSQKLTVSGTSILLNEETQINAQGALVTDIALAVRNLADTTDILSVKGSESVIITTLADAWTPSFQVNVTGGASTLTMNQYGTYFTGNFYTDGLKAHGSGTLIMSSQSGNNSTGFSFRPSEGYITFDGQTTPSAPATVAGGQSIYTGLTGGVYHPAFVLSDGDLVKLYKEAAVTTTQGLADALFAQGLIASSTISSDVAVGEGGLYEGSGTVAAATVATLTNSLQFTGGTGLNVNTPFTVESTHLVKIGVGGVNTKGHLRIENVNYGAVNSKAISGYKSNSDNILWQLDTYLTGTRLQLMATWSAGEIISLSTVQNVGSTHTPTITFGANRQALGGGVCLINDNNVVVQPIAGYAGAEGLEEKVWDISSAYSSGSDAKSGQLSIYRGFEGAVDPKVRLTAALNLDNWLLNKTAIGSTVADAQLDVTAQGALVTDMAFRIRNSADTADIFKVLGDSSADMTGEFRVLNTRVEANNYGINSVASGAGAKNDGILGAATNASGHNFGVVGVAGGTTATSTTADVGIVAQLKGTRGGGRAMWIYNLSTATGSTYGIRLEDFGGNATQTQYGLFLSLGNANANNVGIYLNVSGASGENSALNVVTGATTISDSIKFNGLTTTPVAGHVLKSVDGNGNLDWAALPSSTDTSEWAAYTGTRVGLTLDVSLGDHDNAGNGTVLTIDDSNSSIALNADDGIDIFSATVGISIGSTTSEKIGLFGATPVAQQAALTAQLTSITFTAPSVADYAFQDVTNTSPYGFVDAEELRTLLSVISNLQTRVNELETGQQNLGVHA